MNKILRLALVLFLVSAVVAGVLGVVNELTYPVIDAQKQAKTAEAFSAVLKADRFDEIEFILPDVALLGKNGLCRLCARDGRIFAEGAEREDLVSSAQELYEKRLFEDMRRWDNALDELEKLRDECLGSGSEESVEARLEAFKSALGNVSGRMTDSQRSRLEKIL